MRNLTVLALAAAAVLTAQTQPVTCANASASQDAITPIPTVIDPTCATMPLNLTGVSAQANFDLFGWMSFLALNWPADTATCAANPAGSILSGSGPRVWETYTLDTDIFFGKAGPAIPWCFQGGAAATARLNRLPVKVRPLARQHPEVHLILHQNAKASALLTSKLTLHSAAVAGMQGILQAVGGPLTDQNGRFLRYSVHANMDEYNYLIKNNLNTLTGLANFSGPINFPLAASQYGPTGAMEIKAAWKVLCTSPAPTCKVQDNPAHFYSEQAIVYNDDTGDVSPGPNPVTVGLVGMHITHKVAAQPTWMWITFEQIENTTHSFFNSNCNYPCQPNTQTAATPYTELNTNAQPINQPVQVVPYPNQDQAIDRYNTAFQTLLANSPWAYYRQISTQWTGETPPNPKPLILGNPVLETYIQGSSSCLACHNLMKVTTKNGKVSADFSFMFLGAQ
jgi:hypothetical protein